MLLDLFKPLIPWLTENPNAGGLITFSLAFLESITFIGFFIPGSIMMTAIGALVGSGILPPIETILYAIVGASIGDTVSYAIGRYYHGHIRAMWPLRRYPKLIMRAENFFYRHGGKSIFLGRFLGPIRPVLPLVVGMMNMSLPRFIFADVFSACIWAPAYMLPGIILGAASLALPRETATRLVILILLLVVALSLLSWLIRYLICYIHDLISGTVQTCWDHMQAIPIFSKLHRCLEDPEFPQDSAQFGRLLVALILFALGAWFMLSIKHNGILTAWNLPVYHLFRGAHTDFFFNVALAITGLGQRQAVIPAFLVIGAWLAYRRYWWAAIHWIGSLCLIVGGTWVLKVLLHVARPLGLMATKLSLGDSYSFPSGHVALASAFAGTLVILLARQLDQHARKWIYSIAATFIMLVLLSRLYLGAHWLTDVTASLIFSIAGLLLIKISYYRRPLQPLPTLSFSAIAIMIFLIFSGSYYALEYKKWQFSYTPVWQTTTMNSTQWWDQPQNTLPLYRNDRIGMPDQILNVQWMGDLEKISALLETQGWYKEPPRTFSITLGRIAAKQNSPQLPLLHPLYDDQLPVLALINDESKLGPPIVLQLWPSNIKFNDNGAPLWIGTIYYEALHTGMTPLHPHRIKNRPIAATDEIVPYLRENPWKLKGEVLLVKENDPEQLN